VYVAADGAMGVEEIAAHLGMKRQNVGRELKILGDEGLLELVDSRGGRDIWAKKALDRTLRVSAGLRKQFDLGEDGRPVEPSPKRRGQAKGSRP
jgi:DNA-binding transcriptional ArsR family regulator